MKRKVVYNGCYGGFSLSLEAQKVYIEKKGFTPILHEGAYSWDKYYYYEENPEFYNREIERDDPALVETVKELGTESASGICAKLKIKEVDGPYHIDEYDGFETVITPNDINWR